MLETSHIASMGTATQDMSQNDTELATSHPKDISLEDVSERHSETRLARFRNEVERQTIKATAQAIVSASHSDHMGVVAPKAIRDALRSSYYGNMPFLAQVLAGEVLSKIEYPIIALLPYAECPNCGEVGLAPQEALAAIQTIEVRTSATVKERLAALEHQAKYGLGQLREVSIDDVREKVLQTIQIIRAEASEGVAEAILRRIEPVWSK